MNTTGLTEFGTISTLAGTIPVSGSVVLRQPIRPPFKQRFPPGQREPPPGSETSSGRALCPAGRESR
jgi:hypothetical protein